VALPRTRNAATKTAGCVDLPIYARNSGGGRGADPRGVFSFGGRVSRGAQGLPGRWRPAAWSGFSGHGPEWRWGPRLA